MTKKRFNKKSNQRKSDTATESTFFTFGGVERSVNPLERAAVEFDESTGVYTPPFDRDALAKALTGNSYHGAIVEARTRIISGYYKESRAMSFSDMMNLCKDLVTFGEVYVQLIKNGFGKPERLAHVQSKYTFKGKNQTFFHRDIDDNYLPYNAGEIVQIKLYDVEQNIYGLPDYLSGMQSAMLSEDATKFRRAYYLNGLHAGFILYTTDPAMTPEVEKHIEAGLKNAKGEKAFSSMLINIPNGNEKGVQVIPIGNIGSKDEFNAVKSVSAQEVLVAHRFPGEAAGILPPEGGKLGDPLKYAETYFKNEVLPLHKLIMSINQQLPKPLHLKFEAQEAND